MNIKYFHLKIFLLFEMYCLTFEYFEETFVKKTQ